jgi:glycosyltransferase involved in cell wall biosynthesis
MVASGKAERHRLSKRKRLSQMKLSIIIPVCNVEKYIGPCLESIYRQGLLDEDFEVIVVNDGSTDDSMKVVEEMLGRHKNILQINPIQTTKNEAVQTTPTEDCSIKTQSPNLGGETAHVGPSVCRNKGMERAKGEYVLFVDSDDLLMDNGLSVLLQKALETEADMVVADFMRLKDEEITSVYDSSTSEATKPSAQLTDTRVVDKSGLDYYVEDYDPEMGSFIWRILYKRTFLHENHIRLFPGVYYEDIPFLQECYLKAKRVIGIHLLYYIYRIRQRSCTYSFTMKNAMDYNTAIANSWELTGMDNLPEKVVIQQKKNIYLFFNYAIDCIISVFKDPSDRKKIVDDLIKKVPDLRFTGGLGPLIASALFRTTPYTYIQWRLFKTKVTNWCHVRLGGLRSK